MAEKTKISWCDATFNPWIGCTKVHAGCTHCYAEADMDTRRGRVEWGPNGTRSKTSDDYWKKPLKWNRDAEKAGVRTRVFCASLADVFEDWQGPILYGVKEPIYLSKDGRASNGSNRMTMDDLRADLFKLIDATPNLDWLLLTKRPENIRRMWPERTYSDPFERCRECGCSVSNHLIRCQSKGGYRSNVWLLTSVSDQPTADKMIPELLKCRDLTPVLGVSAEPLLGPVQFSAIPHRHRSEEEAGHGDNDWTTLYGNPLTGFRASSYCSGYTDEKWKLDWIITGGESGPHARPHNIKWSRSIGQQCQAAGVAWFHKQHGAHPIEGGDFHSKTGPMEAVVLKDKSGADPSEWGEGWLQQMPNVGEKL